MQGNEALHYLDNAATTRVDPQVADAVHTAMLENWGNPSSLYTPGQNSKLLLERARSALCRSIGAEAGQVFFTGCGSESNNIALLGAVLAKHNRGKRIVVSNYEHPSVALPLERLEQYGFDVVRVNPDATGHINLEEFASHVDKHTILAACMHVNNETGAQIDMARFAKLVKERNPQTAVHVDGVQGWMRVPVDLTGVDSYSMSGHKIHAPKGVGALYLRKGYNIEPPYLGGGQERGHGGNQEKGVRPGTENLPYAVGIATAASILHKNRVERKAHVHALNQQLRQGLAALPGIQINSPADAVDEVLNFSTMCIKSETLLHFLETRGVYVSSGSACSRGAASPTLAAMGLSARHIDTALRVSFCGSNTTEDVNALLNGLEDGLAHLAKLR